LAMRVGLCPPCKKLLVLWVVARRLPGRAARVSHVSFLVKNVGLLCEQCAPCDGGLCLPVIPVGGQACLLAGGAMVQWSLQPKVSEKEKKIAITENYSQRRVSERAGQAVEELVLSPDAQLWSLNPRADRGAISAESPIDRIGSPVLGEPEQKLLVSCPKWHRPLVHPGQAGRLLAAGS